MLAVRTEMAANDPRHDGCATPCKHGIMPIQWHPWPHAGKTGSLGRAQCRPSRTPGQQRLVDRYREADMPPRINPIGRQTFQLAKKPSLATYALVAAPTLC